MSLARLGVHPRLGPLASIPPSKSVSKTLLLPDPSSKSVSRPSMVALLTSGSARSLVRLAQPSDFAAVMSTAKEDTAVNGDELVIPS